MDNTLAHYSREKLLGEGGMGKVYLAQDNQLQRQVAIKELTYQSTSETVNHALQEARLLARLNHANIIQIYNVHDEGDHISLVMEYFKSKTLTQFQHETHSTLVQKLDLLQQLSAGLAAAHKSNVIHCDLKPTNILVNEQGQLKITDFGIALIANNESRINESGIEQLTPTKPPSSQDPVQYGSLLYMSPEQIKKNELDYRSDIFSLGIVAYQLIVGSHPFGRGAATDIASRICASTPEHAKNLMLNAPSALTDLLMEMLIQPLEQRTLTATIIENRIQHIRTALMQAEINEQATLPLSPGLANIVDDDKTMPNQLSDNNQPLVKPTTPLIKRIIKRRLLRPFLTAFSLALLCFFIIGSFWFYSSKNIEKKQIVILTPILVNSPLMAEMQQDLVISAVEDALRQAVINTKNMYLISRREVAAISKAYPEDLKNLKQAVGASDIISTTLECDNRRCKVSFSRLVANSANNDTLKVASEKNWLVPIDEFNVVFSTSQTQFASLYPEQLAINQAGLVQRPIHEDDYRAYIELYSEIQRHGKYSTNSLTKLESLLTRSPYLYAAYGLYRDAALDLHLDSQDKKYLQQLDQLLQSSPPEYRYSVFEAIDRFWLAADRGDLIEAQVQVDEAKKRDADDLTILGLEAFMFFNAGNYKDATKSYANAFKLRPSTALLNNIAFSYWRMGDFYNAEKTLVKLLLIAPDDYKAKRLQANIWLLQGKLNLAINAYETIVTRLNNGKDLSNLSVAYGLNKQYKKSLEFAKKALSVNPNQAINLLNLADIETILNHKKSAELHYQQIVSLLVGKEELKYQLGLAQAYGQLNEANLAIEVLSKTQKIAPESGEVSYSSAIVYSLLEEQNSAIHHAKKALQHNVGVVWFNLPWFDRLCEEVEFQQLMTKYDNAARCLT